MGGAAFGLGWAGHRMLGGLSEAMGATVSVVGIAAGLLAPSVH